MRLPHPGGGELIRKVGIYGFSGMLYCEKCDKVFDLIVVEFKEPSFDFSSAWGGRCEPMEEYKKEGAVKCPDCGNTDLIFGPPTDRSLRCPRCGVGTMKVTSWFIT